MTMVVVAAEKRVKETSREFIISRELKEMDSGKYR